MLRRLLLLSIPAVLLVFGSFGGCAATDPALGQIGDTCDEDLQCSKPFVCSCVEIRGTGDDGNDEVVKHGTCQHPGYKCIKDDAGTDGPKIDTAPLDAFRPDTAVDDAEDATETGDETGDDADAGG